MSTSRKSRWLLIASILALAATLAGTAAAGYTYLSTRATRWGDSLIVGPRFNGEMSPDGGTTRIRIWWESGSPVVDAPSWKGRGPLSVTFIWGFAVFHTPPGTLTAGTAPAH